jgi:sec-independent protein translocase protein TatA
MFLALGTPGPGELVIILVIVLLLFGAKRLPDLSRSLGKSLSEFKKGREEGLKPSDDRKERIESKIKEEKKA